MSLAPTMAPSFFRHILFIPPSGSLKLFFTEVPCNRSAVLARPSCRSPINVTLPRERELAVYTQAVNIAVVEGKTIISTTELRSDPQGKPVVIKAIPNGKYILAEGENGFAPENITLKRVGKNLHIAVEGTDSDQPQVIIEGFFDNQGQLVGVAEDGTYHEYICSDADQDHSAAFLMDGESSPQVLGADKLSGFDGLIAGSGIGWFWPALLGLAGLAGLAIAAGRDHGDGDDYPLATPRLDSVTDNIGSKTGPLKSGDATDDTTPTFDGSGTPGNTILIKDGDKVIGTTTVNESGKWEFTPATPLSEGMYQITFTEKNPEGTESAPTPPFELTIDITPPGNGGIDLVIDNAGLVTGSIANGGTTDDTTPTLSGGGQTPGDTVTIIDNGEPLATVIVGPDGTWTYTPPPLNEGEHPFTLVVTDPAGNASAPSDPYTIIVDTTAPAAPAITGVLDDQAGITGNISSGGLTNDARPTISGTGEPGATVEVSSNGVPLGTALVNASGQWTLPVTADLPENLNTLTAKATDTAGNASPTSTPYPITVDTTAPAAPAITGVLDDQGAIKGNILSGGTTDDTKPVISGTGEPGATVEVSSNGVPLGTALVNASGQWTLPLTTDLPEDLNTLTAIATDTSGNASPASTPYPITVDTTAPAAPAITGVLDDQGSITGNILSGGTTDDTKPIISGTGEPGATVEIFSNGTPLGTALVNASGQWALALTTDLPENLNTLTAIATDTAGNVSPPSATYAITVDTLSPVASAPIDSMSKDSGTNHSNFITNDGSAGRVIQGSLTSALAAGEKVQVSVDGGVTWLDPTVTGTKWSALDLGSHNANWEIQTRVLDLAGHTNVSSQSVTLDTTVPSPTSVSWDGFNIVVNFNPAGVAVGDKIHLIIDGNSVEHSLTNGDIAAGQAQVPWSSSVHGNSNSIDAAIVDSTGNVSTYLPYVKSTAISILETFDSQPQISLVTGQDYAMNGFKLTAVATSSGGNGSTGFGTTLGLWAEPPSSRALIMTGGSNIKLTMNSGETYNSISFRVGDFNNVESFEARFYDASGTLVYTTTTTPEASGLGFTVTKELPLGLNFSSVTLVSSGSVSNAFWIDNIQLETTQYIEGTLHDPLTNQTITQSGEFYGAETNNTFFIDSVALLDPAGSGIHGGGGIDTLKLTGQNQILDLTNLGQKLESIEVIDLMGNGNNTLKLSLTDVLEQGGASLFTNDGHIQMMVKGNAGDAVILDDLLVNGTDPGNWANSGQVSVSGVVYDVYRHDTLDAELLVQQGVTTTLV
ncbi:Ig-like domain-containing protein [Pseudomonas bubulae]|uniref:Ig-like domain-containing protein n=1 Tax=Pseudomonas bubulae TaxID=2316085 RepID=UPI001F39C08C|nr:Ig-like domain-containing protein [Pseudomonas bubulae]MCF3194467.1 Ig-like domain-containing protein [Pseudomonas bubulae]